MSNETNLLYFALALLSTQDNTMSKNISSFDLLSLNAVVLYDAIDFWIPESDWGKKLYFIF